jgi:NAD(P)-dependent dehydrogenase (short-subunit alcohol dehydrogenase family)
MSWSINSESSQVGRVVIVTGANSGIGYDTAMALAQQGAEVIMACRNLVNAGAAKSKIIAATNNEKVQVIALDLSSLASVKRFTEDFLQQYSRLDLLINNAGIMVPPYSLSTEGFESQLAANYIGHFALTGQLLDLLEKTPGSRIVSLSSVAHKMGKIYFQDIHFKNAYNAGRAYSQSKLACIIFALELQRRLTANNYQTLSVAAHPGVSQTNLDQHVSKFILPLVRLLSQPSAAGALPTLYAALGDDIVGGDFCGPDGFKEMRGKPIKVTPSAQAQDTETAEKLWALTESMTGVKYFSSASD